MNQTDRENLYKLFRDHGDVLGFVRTTVVALKSFMESIRLLKCTTGEIMPLIFDLIQVIRCSEPKIIPLIHLIEQFETEMQASAGQDVDTIKAQAIQILQQKVDLYQSNVQRVTEHGAKCLQDGDTVVVHMASSVVTNILLKAMETRDINLKVIILQQNLVRAKQLINALSKAEIEHVIVPVYNLSHYLEGSNKLLIGAVTVTEDRKIVAPVGTASIVSLCHANNVDVYLFANTLHFSHLGSSTQQIHCELQNMNFEDCAYSMVTYSHDLVDLDMIDHVITEDGEMGKITQSRYLL